MVCTCIANDFRGLEQLLLGITVVPKAAKSVEELLVNLQYFSGVTGTHSYYAILSSA